MPIPVEVLLCVLLLILIVAALRLYSMLGDLRKTLASVEQTRAAVAGTVRKLDVMLTEEIAPTLQAARQNLIHIEVTTKALADATQTARRITAKSEGIAQAAQLLLLGGSVAKRTMGGKAGADAKRAPGKNIMATAGIGLLALLTKRRTKK